MDQEQPQSEAPEIVAEGTFVEAAPTEQQVEPQIEAEPQPTPQEQLMAQKFAALSRKEKQVRDRERQMQQQMAELEQRLKAFEESQANVEQLKKYPDRLKSEPLKVFEEAGLTTEQLTEILLNGGKPTEDMQRNSLESKIMGEIEKLQKRLEEKEQQEAEQKYKQQIEAFVGQLTTFVNDTPDYELIRANDAIQLVYEVIETHHADSGKILSNKEACDLVENHLLEEAKKLVNREKVKKLFGADNTAIKPAQGKSASPTLSNTAASQVPSKGTRLLSDEESLAEAAKQLRWID